jgi:hypothetical protein
MAHLFLNTLHFNDDDRYQTESAILKTTPYSPRVLIVGTYNDGSNAGNHADFFYGRNYFWPIFENFSHNNQTLKKKRIQSPRKKKGVSSKLPVINPPSLSRILELCSHFKLSFADLFTDVKLALPNHDDKHLERALKNSQTENNHKMIVEYIKNTPSITHVYLTTSLEGCKQINELWKWIETNSRKGVEFRKILTPSGRGRLPKIPTLNGIRKICRYWVWVNKSNSHGLLTHKNYKCLDHQWLKDSDVNPLLF